MSIAFTESWLCGPTGTEFYTRTYIPAIPAKACLVFSHGFIEHIARYDHIFTRYMQSAISVFAFDQRGFGRTALDPGPDGKRQSERISRGEGYGRTSSEQQKLDIAWALEYAGNGLAGWGKDGQKLPMFLMGHSMGGCLVLSFGARPPPSFSHRLAGVISTSPLIAQTHPAPKLIRKAGAIASLLSPWTPIPAGVKAEDLSHDKAVIEAYLKDPLVKQQGTLKGVSTMLNLGDRVSSLEFKSWPVDLPLLLIHGDADQVTSYAASQSFYKNIKAKDKTFSSYPDGFHELQNEPLLKQRLIDEVTSWVLEHASQDSNIGSENLEARL